MNELIGKGRPFYSSLDMGAKALKRKVGTGAEFLKELMALPGVKPTELKERGLESLMNEPKMTHEQFLSHLSQKSNPRIIDKTIMPVSDSEIIDDLIYQEAREEAEYLMGRRGRRNADEYDETVDDIAQDLANTQWNRFSQIAERMRRNGEIEKGAAHEGLTLPGGENYREMLIKYPMGNFEGVPQHFHGEPNILASMMLKDRTGPNGEKLLHLEELQSDWHQQGREKGYTNGLTSEEKDELTRLKKLPLDNIMADPQLSERFSLLAQKKKGVPEAPFKKNWEEMAIKRLMHHASEKGYHGIVVTPGEELNKRYSLAKHIQDLHLSGSNLVAYDKNGNEVIKQTGVREEDLPELVGKELAEKLMQQKPQGTLRSLTGQDIEIKGEPMKAFYDKKVPNIFNQLGKKHGVKMELHGHPIEKEPANRLEVGEMVYEDPAKIAHLHHFPITEPMRKDILTNGLPLYNTGGVVHKAEGGNVQPSIEQMRMALQQNKYLVPKATIQSIGAMEAPNLADKIYVEPGRDGNPSVGGVDMDKLTPGMQYAQQSSPQMTPPNQLQQPQQQPQQIGQTPQGAPQSNILNMTPQGQAISAMSPPQQPQPQGYNKGGSAHYEPSPAITKAEMMMIADRMARQIGGEENPNKKTQQQLEREKTLKVGIRKNAPEINRPIINFEELKGASTVGVPGDPSRGGLVPSVNKKGFPVAKAGETLHTIAGEKLDKPVGMFGGYKYGAFGHPESWASDLGASAGLFNVVKRLAEENPDHPVFGHYHKMTPESLRHAVHMLDAIISHHRPHFQPPEHIAYLNNLMKNEALTKDKNDVPYPEFPGFENPMDVMIHGAMNSGMRKKIAKLLGTEKHFPGGKQKMDDIIFALSHPELRNVETGAGGSAIMQFDPTRDLKSTLSMHPTYAHDIPSKLVGRTRYLTPAEILAPRSMANAKREIEAMGKKVVPFNQAKMNIIREPIDEQYINQMGEYEHQMKKRLGYKKGGKVSLDVMHLELSKKSKKAKK